MFKIEDKTIYVTRGDKLIINETDLDIDTTSIVVDDYVVFRLYNKKKLNELPLLEKKVIVEEDHKFSIELSKDETKIGELLNKPSTYWYEIEVNGENTIVGYDENGAKLFILYPEGDVEEPIHEHEFGEYVYDSNSGMEISHCNGCDEIMERAHEHNYGSASYTASENEKHNVEKTCSVCGYVDSYIEDCDFENREYNNNTGVDVGHCSHCSNFKELAHIHHYGSWETISKYECQRICSDCNHPQLQGHNFVDMDEYEECSDCGYQRQKNQHSHTATGTRYENYTRDIDSHCCEKVTYCLDPECGEEIFRMQIDHEWILMEDDGWSELYACIRCGIKKEIDKDIPLPF